MSKYLQRYAYYWLICAGAMLMTLTHFMFGSLTASIIYGTEISASTIHVAGWFILFAPAFLAWLDGER